VSVLVGKGTRLLTQGITGSAGRLHTLACRQYGTKVVGGVTPGRGGEQVDGVPVFDTVSEAVERTDANVTMVFVPAPFAADAVLEAVDARVPLIVCITEGIPAIDEARMKRAVVSAGLRMIGPNCPGVITPGEAKVGIMPGYIHKPGRIGVVSRSGTLTYEAVWQLTNLGLGQSTCIGIGGDPVIGTTFVDAMRLFQDDPGTDAILLIGEIGGTAEEDAAAFIRAQVTKPVAGFVAGATAPPGRRMGHAGAIVAGGKGTAAEKQAALRDAGVLLAESPADMGATMAAALRRSGGSRRGGGRSKTNARKRTTVTAVAATGLAAGVAAAIALKKKARKPARRASNARPKKAAARGGRVAAAARRSRARRRTGARK
jgi:succinyl-CoA synthetase alpha subunit